MPDKDVMLQIRQLEEQLGWRSAELVEPDPDETDPPVTRFAAALAQLAGDWRMLADLYDKAKLKGAKTAHVDPLRAAARKIDEVIEQLRKPRRAPLGQVQPVSGPPSPAPREIAPHVYQAPIPLRGGGALTGQAECIATASDGLPCGRYPGAPVHDLQQAKPPLDVSGLDALIADSVAERRDGLKIIDDATLPEGVALGVTDEQRDDTGKMMGDLHDMLRAGYADDLAELGVPKGGPTFPGQVTGDEVRAYLAGVADDIPSMPPAQPATVRDMTELGATLPDVPPPPPGAFAIPPAPLLGQPGDAGAGYAPTYVPTGAKPMTYADLMTPVPAAALPPHLSHSQIGTLADCPGKYRGTRLAGTAAAPHVVEIPQWANIGGTVFHRIVEGIERDALSPDPQFDNGDTAEKLWTTAFDAEVQKIEQSSPVPRTRWRAANKGAENETWWRANGPEMIKRYLAARPSEPTPQLPTGDHSGGAGSAFREAIEIELTVEVPTPYGPIDYKAIIDHVTLRSIMTEVGPDVTLVIRDYKTGRMPDDTSQLGEYANTLRLLGVPPQVRILGTFFDARKGVWTPEVDLDKEWPAEWFAYHVTQGHARKLALTTGPTGLRPSSFCGGCSVRYACPIKGVKA